MEHIVALLLIVGCSDDLATCKELPAPVALFESAEECEAELPASLRSYSGEYPQILAKCVDVDPANEEDAELAWNIDADGVFYASVDVPEIVVASGGKDERLFTGAE